MANEELKERLRGLPIDGRKLLCVIVRQTYHGSLRSKECGVATFPEVHEACGLDVDGMYGLIGVLCNARVIELNGHYPFEEIRLCGTEGQVILGRCDQLKIALEDVIVDLRFDLLDK